MSTAQILNPAECAAAARRIAAKLVADQANDIILSMVGMKRDPCDEESVLQSIDNPNAAIVIVARGDAMLRLLELCLKRKPKSIEFERRAGGGATA